LTDAATLITGEYTPRPGDLLLARVDKLNQHRRLELVSGRRANLHPGDEILVCYGNRYAPDQFEAVVPGDLSPCHLVAAGGIAARSLSRNAKIRPATCVTPIGVLADGEGCPLNLAAYGLAPKRAPARRPRVTAVVGTAMNAGKTTTLANLALGLSRQGLKVGAAKVTGTGAGCDVWQMVDAGCHRVLDFTDCGVPSTYQLALANCEAIMESLVGYLCESGSDSILIEVADGILQKETRELVMSATFARLVDNVIFAAADALGAASGATWLQAQGLNVVGVSGALTAAPLAMRECAALVDLPLLTLDTLNSGRWVPRGSPQAPGSDASSQAVA
jgi:molybdopterin-guanine dinucleotide biosynthesis protein